MTSTSAVATVWRHRALLRALAIRDIKNRYAGSVAGAVWALLNPLIMLGIYGIIFEYVFKVRVPNQPLGQPYVLFVALALWPWLAFQEALIRGTTAIQSNSALVKKVAFPHELLIYSAVLGSFLVHMCGFVVVLVVLRLFGLQVYLSAWPVVALAFVILLIMATAFALLLGSLQVFIRDVEQILSQTMSVLFYATPILFPMSLVPPWLASVMLWNPLVPLLETIRSAFLNSAKADLVVLGITLAGAMLFFYGARRVFVKLSTHFEDMV